MKTFRRVVAYIHSDNKINRSFQALELITVASWNRSYPRHIVKRVLCMYILEYQERKWWIGWSLLPEPMPLSERGRLRSSVLGSERSDVTLTDGWDNNEGFGSSHHVSYAALSVLSDSNEMSNMSGEKAGNVEQDYRRGYATLACIRLGRACLSFFSLTWPNSCAHEAQTFSFFCNNRSVQLILSVVKQLVRLLNFVCPSLEIGRLNLKDPGSKTETYFIPPKINRQPSAYICLHRLHILHAFSPIEGQGLVISSGTKYSNTTITQRECGPRSHDLYLGNHGGLYCQFN